MEKTRRLVSRKQVQRMEMMRRRDVEIICKNDGKERKKKGNKRNVKVEKDRIVVRLYFVCCLL